MSRKHVKKYTYDISLDEGPGAQLVGWITGLMVFFTTLALAVCFGLSGTANTWVTNLSGTLTVEIKPPLSPADGGKISGEAREKFNARVESVLGLLKKSPLVAKAQRLSDSEIKGLVEPWLGRGTERAAALDAIPLPALIDVAVVPGASVAQLESAVKALEPSATVDRQNATLEGVKALVGAATLFMLLLTGVIVALAVATISGIVRSKLMISTRCAAR
jgi:cell division transport system permease protein